MYEISRVGKAIETENRLVVVSGWGEGKWTATANGYGAYFRGDKNVLEYSIVRMVVQPCVYVKIKH